MQRRVLSTIGALLLLSIGAFAPAETRDGPIRLAPEAGPELIRSVLQRGETLESERRWSEALTHYEEALREHPGNQELKKRLDLTRIHYDLGRRYRDASFQEAVNTLNLQNSLLLYSEVAEKISTHYVSPPDWTQMVARGTTCLDIALDRAAFRDFNLRNADPDQVKAFRGELYRTVSTRVVRSRHDARRLVHQVALLAQHRLAIPPTAVVLEYTCGAAGGLDDYCAFLTADQLRDVYSQIEGNFVGLGVELKAEDGSLLIVHVIPGSPAEKAQLKSGDRIVAVGGRSTAQLTSDQAASMLQGEEGTYADISVRTAGQNDRPVRIRREHIDVPSVEDVRIVDAQHGVGYVKLPAFQKSTGRDLDAALRKLHRQGMRSLIVDLRGNPGGLLNAAVEVSDMFVTHGSLVSTRGRNPQEDFVFGAHTPGTWSLPLVVLIDSDSASASEIFAAAIRDHGRGTIVGSRSYGKGSVQGIFPLGYGGTGVRLTTARFFSPHNRPISKVGVYPDIIVRQTARAIDPSIQQAGTGSVDAVLDAGLIAARRQLAGGE